MAMRESPAAQRNRAPIADVLEDELPHAGRVLEIASGTGEHVVHFAARFPNFDWHPTDPQKDSLASIAAYRDAAGLDNIMPPVALDASADKWPLDAADTIVCINMVHISPWEATQGLFAGAARLLPPHDGPLVLYGGYCGPLDTVDENRPAHSVTSFDAGLGLSAVAAGFADAFAGGRAAELAAPN